MRRTNVKLFAIVLLTVAALSVGLTAQKNDTSAAQAAAANLPERIWQDPGDMASLDLLYGSGGKAHAPDEAGAFTFVAEDHGASSPKFDVTDGQGVAWKVKLGRESQAETAATRFMWAAGYFVDEDYYAAEVTVKGLPTLQRGQQFVAANGVVHGARLERKRAEGEKIGGWAWTDNPFVGKRELNGLRVMMAVLNNWDLKTVNNAIYVVDGERRYAISDLGATFGKTGNGGTRSKGVPRDYEESTFIAETGPALVDFVFNSRPFFLMRVISPGEYISRTRMEQIARDVPRADAKWLGQRLSMLTDDQIRDGFRAAGYGAGDVATLARTIRLRFAALEAL